MFNQNIKKKQKLILAAIFIFVFAVGFRLGKHASADSCECVNIDELNNTGKIIYLKSVDQKDEASCRSYCGSQNSGLGDAYRFNGGTTSFTKTTGEITELQEGSADICGVLDWFSSTFFNCLLLKILTFIGYLVSASAALFEWIIDANNLKMVLSNDVIYTIWGTVRDVLNIAFILVLLFSAFCTVFQVEKFNYKKILLTLIIMALLVNFSFPIARVIIDFSNVIMFSFLKSMGGTNSFAQIAETGGLAKIVHPQAIPDISYLIAAIVFTFILAVTFIVIAVLMVIRTVALAILIIFSPVAFVGSIVPFLSSKASAWWDSLFKYSFFGPIMIFMMYIAIKMMGVISTRANFQNVAKLQSSGSGMADLIASYSFFAIPIVILWIGIGTAQTMSIAGASAVVGRGEKFMKSVGGWTAKAPFRGAWWGMKKTGAPGAIKQRWDQYKKEGQLGSERTAQREAAIAHKLSVKGAKEKDMKRRAEEFKKNFAQPDELKALAAKGDAAAAFRLAEDKDMDQETYEKFLSANTDASLHKAVNSKLKQNRADIVANYSAKKSAEEKVAKMSPTDISNERADAVGKGIAGASTWTDNQVKNYARQKEMNSKAREEFGKLGAEKFAEQDFVEMTKLEPGKTYTPDQIRSIKSATASIYGMSGSARAEASKILSPSNRKALLKAIKDLGLKIPPI